VNINGKVGCACTSFSLTIKCAGRIWRNYDVIWQLVNIIFCSITSSWRQVCNTCTAYFGAIQAKLFSFSSSMERAEHFWRHNDVIWRANYRFAKLRETFKRSDMAHVTAQSGRVYDWSKKQSKLKAAFLTNQKLIATVSVRKSAFFRTITIK